MTTIQLNTHLKLNVLNFYLISQRFILVLSRASIDAQLFSGVYGTLTQSEERRFRMHQDKLDLIWVLDLGLVTYILTSEILNIDIL